MLRLSGSKIILWLVARRPAAKATIILALALVFTPASARAHGVVGNRGFLSPIVGNDAFPDNALGLSTRGSGYAFSIAPTLEKQLSDHSSLLLTTGWGEVEPRSRREASGAQDLAIYFRQSIYLSAIHEMEVTLSPFVIAPTGDRQVGDQGYTHLGGELLIGKGLGDLPQDGALKWLRPLALQAEAGYAVRVQGPAHSDLVGNFELEYSLRYLDQYVEHFELGEFWPALVPYAQFNYSQSLMASRLTTVPDFRLTPGIAYESEYCEVSVGAQLALNRAAQPNDRIAAVGLVEIFYDNLFPSLGRNPF